MDTDKLTEETPRKKPGRPKLPTKKVAGYRVSLRLYEREERALKKIMKQKKMSESEAIRFALRSCAGERA
jgi:hypothetical protein